MTFINWSDSEEMLGLLVEYVADEKAASGNDAARRRFLADLSAELAALAEDGSGISLADTIEQLRALYESRSGEFSNDPVLTHVEDCIHELERLRSRNTG